MVNRRGVVFHDDNARLDTSLKTRIIGTLFTRNKFRTRGAHKTSLLHFVDQKEQTFFEKGIWSDETINRIFKSLTLFNGMNGMNEKLFLEIGINLNPDERMELSSVYVNELPDRRFNCDL